MSAVFYDVEIQSRRHVPDSRTKSVRDLRRSPLRRSSLGHVPRAANESWCRSLVLDYDDPQQLGFLEAMDISDEVLEVSDGETKR